MGQFGASIQTANYSNWLTQIDQYNSSLLTYPLPNGAMNPLGSDYFDNTPATAGATVGTPRRLVYARYLSTSNPTPTNAAGPFPVYWVDSAKTTVTPVASESLSGGINSIAGLAGPNLTSLNMTAAQLLAAIAGNYIWVCTWGYVANAAIGVTTTAADASLIGSTTNFKMGAVAAGTAPTNRVLGWATAASGATPTFFQNMMVAVES